MFLKKCKFSIVAVPLIVLGVAALWHHLTSQWLEWYSFLLLPNWLPSGWVIGIAWALIFLSFIISVLLFCYKSVHDKRFWMIASLFVDNLIMNVLRNRLFFVRHSLTWAIVDAILLFVITVLLIVSVWSRSKWSAILLIPYALWLIVTIVIVVNVMILW